MRLVKEEDAALIIEGLQILRRRGVTKLTIEDNHICVRLPHIRKPMESSVAMEMYGWRFVDGCWVFEVGVGHGSV